MNVQKSIIGLWPNLSRAVEIAMLGGYEVTIVYHSDYKAGREDYESIVDFYSPHVDFSGSGAITVEISQPIDPVGRKVFQYETLEDILGRVEKARGNTIPTVFPDSSSILLKTAANRLNLSLKAIDSIASIAGTIAQLDGAKEVRPEHVAEAILYRGRIVEDGYIVAAADTVVFSGVRIVRSALTPESIEGVVNYLNRARGFWVTVPNG